MTEMFGEAWPPMSVPDLAPDDDDESGTTFPDYRGMGGISACRFICPEFQFKILALCR